MTSSHKTTSDRLPHSCLHVAVALLMLVALPTWSAEDRVVRLQVYPASLRLNSLLPETQLVVTAQFADGSRRDVTREVQVTSTQDAIVEVSSRGYAKALRNGESTLIFRFAGADATAAVLVHDLEKSQPVSFRYGTLAVLSKQGCNSGGCHGSPSGKGGFRLSLFAYDPQLDALTMSREYLQRRIDLFRPAGSLLLQKPLMSISHGGGQRLKRSGIGYRLLHRWISQGAGVDDRGPDCVGIDVYPQQRLLMKPAISQQLSVIARFSDGSRRDVTRLAVYSVPGVEVAQCNENGLVTASIAGEATIAVRYADFVQISRLGFLDQRPDYRWSRTPEKTRLDRHVFAKLREMQLKPAELCSDAQFVRRLHLDLTGRLPSAEVAERFIENEKVNKRGKLIDVLLDSPDFARFWATQWGDLLRVKKSKLGDAGVHKFHRWLVRSIAANQPYDQFVSQLLTGSGPSFENPPASYYRSATTTDDCTETTTQLFLGIRIQCAKCHNHPYEKWKQDHYYGIGAFFVRMQRTKLADGDIAIWSAAKGEITQPRTGRTMQPWLPEKGTIEVRQGEDRRHALSQWMTRPENPFFARMAVNRIWARVMGRGIVDPVDDFRVSNPPSNPALLDYLAKEFVSHRFDRKHLLRVILNSRTYQLDSHRNVWNRGHDAYFSHYRTRRLSAEQILDAVSQVSGVAERYEGLPAGALATQLPAPSFKPTVAAQLDFLRVFGKPARNTACSCERNESSDLAQALEMINGSVIEKHVRHEKNVLRRWLSAGLANRRIVERLHLRAFSRLPNPREAKIALAFLSKAASRQEALEDLLWTIFNSKEFLFQH